MKDATWYFDFISPFAFLQWRKMAALDERARLVCQPVLLVAMLRHWGQLGPAEIEPKRRFTCKHIYWIARRDGVTLRFPPRHPFNPLPLLRLCIACGNTPQVVGRLLDYVWAEGRLPDETEHWEALLDELGIAPAALEQDAVKQALRTNTDTAIKGGVFGVPTLVVDDELFWGYDSFQFALDYLDDPGATLPEALRAPDAPPPGKPR